ncbi:MAG: hypothetical protein KGK15_17520 [Burkholderiales bacterium]|nr:hypothetical protein [Burkholderiales bacterium]MDE2290062.1 hypothetical protein [Burkholderiales bacterium]MDE2609171.1 hypothetical protein [Burkholderiales bacterium]
MPSNTVFWCIGVYTPYRYRWQRFDKTFVLQDSEPRDLMRRQLRADDLLVIWKLDRMGRVNFRRKGAKPFSA